MPTIQDLLRITVLSEELEKDQLSFYDENIRLAEAGLQSLLKEVSEDTHNLEPLISPLLEEAHLRPDVAEKSDTSELLKSTKNTKDGYYLVPKFL